MLNTDFLAHKETILHYNTPIMSSVTISRLPSSPMCPKFIEIKPYATSDGKMPRC